jgi:hypothetical protein
MPDSNLSKTTFLLFAVAILFCGCNDYGQKIVVDGTEVYFDGKEVAKADAEQLGNALQELKFTDGVKKAVQLQRDGDKLIFKMVVQSEYLDSRELDGNFEMMCLELSAAFDGNAVECHACDNQLISKRKFHGLRGKLTDLGKSDFYTYEINDEQLERVIGAMKTLGFVADDVEGTMYFGKVNEAYEFRLACLEEYRTNEDWQNETRIWQEELSKAVGGQKVTVMLCDGNLQAAFTREVN